MTKRPYGQSRDVPIAEFLYRHEAELAAGFLEDAGIPFRLQVDDAGGADIGVTIARPAVLWVREEHTQEARELLELPEPAGTARGPSPVPVPSGSSASGASAGSDPPLDPFVRLAPTSRSREGGPGSAPERSVRSAAHSRDTEAAGSAPLSVRERVVAGALASGLAALTRAAWPALADHPRLGAAVVLGCMGAAVALGASALTARTVEPLRTWLRALSGSAP